MCTKSWLITFTDLEISKPQRNKNQGGRDSRQRRSRSPDNRNRATIDRYRGGDNRRQRSPSPRSRNRYGRRRSRSRSPQHGRRRESHQSDFDDDCPLPRRSPHDVPDLQIIAKDNPDRQVLRLYSVAPLLTCIGISSAMSKKRLRHGASKSTCCY